MLIYNWTSQELERVSKGYEESVPSYFPEQLGEIASIRPTPTSFYKASTPSKKRKKEKKTKKAIEKPLEVVEVKDSPSRSHCRSKRSQKPVYPCFWEESLEKESPPIESMTRPASLVPSSPLGPRLKWPRGGRFPLIPRRAWSLQKRK